MERVSTELHGNMGQCWGPYLARCHAGSPTMKSCTTCLTATATGIHINADVTMVTTCCVWSSKHIPSSHLTRPPVWGLLHHVDAHTSMWWTVFLGSPAPVCSPANSRRLIRTAGCLWRCGTGTGPPGTTSWGLCPLACLSSWSHQSVAGKPHFLYLDPCPVYLKTLPHLRMYCAASYFTRCKEEKRKHVWYEFI